MKCALSATDALHFCNRFTAVVSAGGVRWVTPVRYVLQNSPNSKIRGKRGKNARDAHGNTHTHTVEPKARGGTTRRQPRHTPREVRVNLLFLILSTASSEAKVRTAEFVFFPQRTSTLLHV